MSQQAPLSSRTALLALRIDFYCKRCTRTRCANPHPQACIHACTHTCTSLLRAMGNSSESPPIHKKPQRQPPHGRKLQPTSILTPRSSIDKVSQCTHTHIFWELIKIRPFQTDLSQRNGPQSRSQKPLTKVPSHETKPPMPSSAHAHLHRAGNAHGLLRSHAWY